MGFGLAKIQLSYNTVKEQGGAAGWEWWYGRQW